MIKRGMFITFEGIDGCGKSTQIFKLAKHIFNLDKYNHVMLTREPYKNQDIRKILREDNDPYSQALKLAEMFIADRELHTKELIGPLLSDGRHVISDRYDLSTMAYQQTQGIEFNKLLEMHQGLLIPNITFIVDLPVEIALERMKKENSREMEKKFEDPKNRKFMEDLRQNYLDLPMKISANNRIYVIDGRASADEIFDRQIKPIFDKHYEAWKK
jgi:dTMP kinase